MTPCLSRVREFHACPGHRPDLPAAVSGHPPCRHGSGPPPTVRLTRDTMSLAGILSTVADDPRLSRALDIGRAETRAAGAGGDAPRVLPGVDLVAPSSLRPVLTAAIAAEL